MPESFSLEFTQAEKQYLHSLVRNTIARAFNPSQTKPMPTPDSELLKKELGAFVTLKRQGQLRGCIGWLVGTEPLTLTIARMAEAAAFNDPRFPALKEHEQADLSVEISIMGPISLCPDPALIEVGKHGLIMRSQSENKQGLLLPQVPVEQKWNRETFLKQTCLKAGLATDSWQSKHVEILWFEAVIF